MRTASSPSAGIETTVTGRQRQHDREHRKLGQQQTSVERAEQPRHGADLRPRVPETGEQEHDHQRQRRRGEPTRREHRVGTGVGTALLTREREQKRQRGETADPHAGRQQMRHVDDDGDRRVRLHRGGVAGGGGEAQRSQAEQRALAPRRPPVAAVRQVHPHGEKRAEQEQQTAAHQPDRARLGLQQHADDRGAIERRAGPSLQDCRLAGHRDHCGEEGDQNEQPPGTDDSLLPAQGSGTVGRSRQEQHGGAADEQDRGCEVQPAGEKRDGHCCQSKLTASVRANRPLADDITRIVGLPMVTVIFVVAAGRLTSVP